MTFTLGLKETGTGETCSFKRDPVVGIGQIISMLLIHVMSCTGKQNEWEKQKLHMYVCNVCMYVCMYVGETLWIKVTVRRRWWKILEEWFVANVQPRSNFISSQGSYMRSALQCVWFGKIIHANCGEGKERFHLVHAIKAFGDVEV